MFCVRMDSVERKIVQQEEKKEHPDERHFSRISQAISVVITRAFLASGNHLPLVIWVQSL